MPEGVNPIEEAADSLLRDPRLQESIEKALSPGRIGTVKKEAYKIQKLNDVHKEVIRLRVQGVTPDRIAAMIGYDEMSIKMLLRNPLVRKEINRLHGLRDFSAVDASARLDGLVERAIDVYERIITGEESVEPMDQVKVANEILDRTGFGRVSKVEGNHRVQVLTSEDVQSIKAQALARAKESGAMIDVTPIDDGEAE